MLRVFQELRQHLKRTNVHVIKNTAESTKSYSRWDNFTGRRANFVLTSAGRLFVKALRTTCLTQNNFCEKIPQLNATRLRLSTIRPNAKWPIIKYIIRAELGRADYCSIRTLVHIHS